MNNLAEDALRTMHTAYLAAEASGIAAVQTTHVFQGLLNDAAAVGELLQTAKKAFSAALILLGRSAIPEEIVSVDVMQRIYQSNLALSPDLEELHVRATGLAQRWQHPTVRNVHLLHSLLAMDCPDLEPILQNFGFDKYALMAQCLTILKKIPQAKSSAPLEANLPAETFSTPSDWMIEEVLDTISSAMDRTSRDNCAIHPDHLLSALLDNPQGPIAESLQAILDLDQLRKTLSLNLASTSFPADSQLFNQETMEIVARARSLAAELGSRKVTMRDLFLALIESIAKKSCRCSLAISMAQATELRHHYYQSVQRKSVQHKPLKPKPSVPATAKDKPTSSSIAMTVAFQVLSLLNEAKEEAQWEGATEVTNVHLLKAWLKSAVIPEEPVSEMRTAVLEELERLPVNTLSQQQKGKDIGTDYSITSTNPADSVKFSDGIRATLSLSADEAANLGDWIIQTNHIMLAMIDQDLPIINEIFTSSGSGKDVVRRRLNWCNDWHRRSVNLGPVVHINMSELDSFVERERWPKLDRTPIYLKALSISSKRLLHQATKESVSNGSSDVGVEHFAIALSNLVSGRFAMTNQVLCELNGRESSSGKLDVDKTLLPRGSKRACQQKLSPNSHKLLQEAWWHAQSFGRHTVEPEHILLAIATESQGIAFVACGILDIDGHKLADQLLHRLQTKSA